MPSTPNPTRRDFLKASTIAGGALLLANRSIAAPPSTTPSPDKYITCFYQFSKASLAALSGPGGLPNGSEYLHLFTASHEGHAPHPEVANNVRACGPSFKYARAIDIWKYKDWKTASDKQLRQWSIEFRDEALPEDGPSDYFAFNEFPSGAESSPDLQRRVARWMRYLHNPNDGRGDLKAVFYFVEENLNPLPWKVEESLNPLTGNGAKAIAELFAAIDDTSLLVVGEHYHNQKFLTDHTPEQLSDHFFALPKWLDASNDPAQQNIARYKYAVLHSTYYGPRTTDWQGLQQSTSTPDEFKTYLQKLIEVTRKSPYGKSRIAFGPLYTRELDEDDILASLAPLLHQDAIAR